MKILHLNTPSRDGLCVNATRPTLAALTMARKRAARMDALDRTAPDTDAHTIAANGMDACESVVRA